MPNISDILAAALPGLGKAVFSQPADKAAAQAKVERAQAVVDGEVQSHLDEIPQLIADGIPTFKLFMTYRKANVMIDDVYMLKVLAAVRDAGGRCGFHAECNAIAEYN